MDSRLPKLAKPRLGDLCIEFNKKELSECNKTTNQIHLRELLNAIDGNYTYVLSAYEYPWVYKYQHVSNSQCSSVQPNWKICSGTHHAITFISAWPSSTKS